MTANSELIAAAAKRRADWRASLQMLPEHRLYHPYEGDCGIGNQRIYDAMILANAYLDGLPEVEKIKEQVDELRGVLANLSLYLSAGSGDDSTTPAEFERRIRWGIDEFVRIERERACMPQWLPAGSLPDAEGWWLVCKDGDVWPINVRIGKDVFVMCGDTLVAIESVYRGCRFARLAMPAGPSDGC